MKDSGFKYAFGPRWNANMRRFRVDLFYSSDSSRTKSFIIKQRRLPTLVSWVLDDDEEVVLVCRERKEDNFMPPPDKERSSPRRSRGINTGFSPGAIMISFFLERTRRKVRSFWGSMSRMVVLAFISSW